MSAKTPTEAKRKKEEEEETQNKKLKWGHHVPWPFWITNTTLRTPSVSEDWPSLARALVVEMAM